MTFGPDHYVPILKIKRGEKAALQEIAPRIRARITPLLEIVERKPEKVPAVAGHLNNAFKSLDRALSGLPRYLLDCREIAPDGPVAAADVFARATSLQVPFTPVTGLSRGVDEKAALSHKKKNGIAIRLTRDEFEAGRVPSELPVFMKTRGLEYGEVDLILDLGAVENMVAPGIEALASAFLADVPATTQWRTLAVSGCAFPLSMGGVDRNSFERVDRAEWQAWKAGLYACRSSLERLPTFSDCAIQHPIGVEGFDPRIMAASASIRYTLPDHWLLIKGVSTKIILPGQQFPQLATDLAYGHLSRHYAGAAHCKGCLGMKACADSRPKLGSPEAWRRLGTIHHITRAVEEISSLTWP